ncbi:hypothetical protein [Halopelagius fulvigenes]|uniref:DUF8106 domain-containing protein n=1 Tax=Halopelagius fulvigenes TaxID=1198324 RepID=A0ABD5TYY3_9EURY
MSAMERNPNAAGDEERRTVRKDVLFCPDCGRIASSDRWEWNDGDDVETLDCPNCGTTLTTRPHALA